MTTYHDRVVYLGPEDDETEVLKKDFVGLVFRITRKGKMVVVKDSHGFFNVLKDNKIKNNELRVKEKGLDKIQRGDWVFGLNNSFSGYVESAWSGKGKFLFNGELKSGGYFPKMPMPISSIKKVITADFREEEGFRETSDFFKIEATIKSMLVYYGFNKHTSLKMQGINNKFKDHIPSTPIGPLENTMLNFENGEIVLDSARGVGYLYKDGNIAHKLKE